MVGTTTVATLITNDEYENTIIAPVNPNTNCAQTLGGTALAITASAILIAPCIRTPNDDIWFQFTAITNAHSISLSNLVESTTNIYYALYTGYCGNLTQVACTTGTTSNATTLIVKQV